MARLEVGDVVMPLMFLGGWAAYGSAYHWVKSGLPVEVLAYSSAVCFTLGLVMLVRRWMANQESVEDPT